jgi:hypothetical protein
MFSRLKTVSADSYTMLYKINHNRFFNRTAGYFLKIYFEYKENEVELREILNSTLFNSWAFSNARFTRILNWPTHAIKSPIYTRTG